MSSYFNIFALGFCLAIILCSFFKIGITFGFLVLVLSFFISYFSFKYLKGNAEGRRVFSLAFFIFAFAIGIIRYEISNSVPIDVILNEKINSKVEVKGVIRDEPKLKENGYSSVVQLSGMKEDNEYKKVFGIALVGSDLFPKPQYGDEILIKGQLTLPENFVINESEFDYRSYLEKDGIKYKIDFARIEIISQNKGNAFKAFLFSIKNSFLSKIRNQIPEPQASFLGGLLLGEKNSIGKDLEEDFKRSGVMHLVVLSGYNITIVAESIMKLFSFLPRNFSFGLGAVGIILFSILTGGSSTVVRASIMALLVLLARFIHRDYQIKRALILAGLVMLFVNPKILIFDPSFQLSFLATLSLIYLTPVISSKLIFITEKWNTREIVAASIGTQMLVLPLLIKQVGVFSLVFLPVNILVLPFIPITMFAGFFTGLLGFISHIIAWPATFLSWVLLSYELFVIRLFSKIPFSLVSTKNWGITFVILFYILVLVLIYRKKFFYRNKNVPF